MTRPLEAIAGDLRGAYAERGQADQAWSDAQEKAQDARQAVWLVGQRIEALEAELLNACGAARWEVR